MEKDRQINKFLDPESKMERIEQDSDKMIEIECEEKMEEMIQSLLESGSDKEVEDH
jgi:hypothetical protein